MPRASGRACRPSLPTSHPLPLRACAEQPAGHSVGRGLPSSQLQRQVYTRARAKEHAALRVPRRRPSFGLPNGGSDEREASRIFALSLLAQNMTSGIADGRKRNDRSEPRSKSTGETGRKKNHVSAPPPLETIGQLSLADPVYVVQTPIPAGSCDAAGRMLMALN